MMIYSPQEAYESLINELDQRTLKYSIHEFDSGAKMVDIWHKNLFYVVQIEDDFAGISLIDENSPGFDTIPDMRFSSVKEFTNKLKNIF